MKVSGTVRELVFDDEVAQLYLGPTLTARLRGAAGGGCRMRTGLSQQTSDAPGAADQSAPVPGDGPALHAAARPPAAPEAGAARPIRSSSWWSRRRTRTPEQADSRAGEGDSSRRNDEIDWEEILLDGFDVGGTPRAVRGARVHRAGHGRDHATSPTTCSDQMQMLDLTPRQQLLAEEFVGNINEDGYLAASLEEILDRSTAGGAHAARCDARTRRDEDDAERWAPSDAPRSRSDALHAWPRRRRCCAIIQKLDPPGVGARDLRECLLLQLARRRTRPSRCPTGWCTRRSTS